MDALTELIKQEIKRKYKSVRRFAFEMDIPPSTLISALNKGIGGTSFDTVVEVCEKLGIKTVLSDPPIYLDKDARTILEGYNALDSRGKHTVETMLQLELMRCGGQPMFSEKTGKSSTGMASAYGGAYSDRTDLKPAEQIAAMNALRKIRENSGLE